MDAAEVKSLRAVCVFPAAYYMKTMCSTLSVAFKDTEDRLASGSGSKVPASVPVVMAVMFIN